MDSVQATEFIAEYASTVINNHCTNAAAVLVLYDLVITTGDEMRLFWRQKVTGAMVLFLLNKWLAILFFSWALAGFFKLSDTSCAVSVKILFVLEQSLYLVWAAFAALRVYALHKNLLLFTAVFLLSIVCVGVNLSRSSVLTGENIPVFGCVSEDTTSVDRLKLYTILSRSCLIMGDCIAIGVTWSSLRRGYTMRQIQAFEGRRTIANVLLWDGSLYFLILVCLNAMHLTFTLLSIDINILENLSYVTEFSTPFYAILVSHFLLHLQHANLKAVGADSSLQEQANGSSLVFERVVGSLGASILPDDYFANEDHSDENIVD